MSELPVSMDTEDEFLIVGPFNLNKRMMRADTVMGERLQLNPRQFRTFLMLASKEGQNVPFDELRHFMSLPGEEKCPEHDARSVVESLVNVVNISGRGFAWVHEQPRDEYVFETKWGAEWHKPSFEVDGKESEAEARIAVKKPQNLPGFVLTATTLLVIIGVALGAFFFEAANAEQLVYIPFQQIPLAGSPFSGVLFPNVTDIVYVSGENSGVSVFVYSQYEGDVLFLMSIWFEYREKFVSPSVPVPFGESVLFFYLNPSLGLHEVRIVLRAFELPGLEKLGATFWNLVLQVD